MNRTQVAVVVAVGSLAGVAAVWASWNQQPNFTDRQEMMRWLAAQAVGARATTTASCSTSPPRL